MQKFIEMIKNFFESLFVIFLIICIGLLLLIFAIAIYVSIGIAFPSWGTIPKLIFLVVCAAIGTALGLSKDSFPSISHKKSSSSSSQIEPNYNSNGFFDGASIWRNNGEAYQDAQGNWRNPGSPFIDGQGKMRNPGEPWQDSEGHYYQPGQPFKDGKGIWRK